MEIPVTLNVKSANVIPVINCMQGDTPTIICTIMNGDDTFIADPGEFDLCVCEGETAKHKAISIKCAVNSNIVTVHLTKNETDEAGDLKLCISFSNTAQELVVSTFPFILKATENPAYSAVGQKENIKALTDYVAEAKKYADAAKDSGANIYEYVDNAKKYAESASESVINAETAEKLSQSYAIGDSGVREGEEKDNSKYYSEKSAESKQAADKAVELAGQKAEEARQLGLEASENAKSASESVIKAEKAQKLSQSYAIGNSGLRENEDTDNSKWYAQQAEKYAKQAEDIAGGNFIPNSEKGIAGGVAVLNANLAVEKAVGDEDGNNIKNTYAKKTETTVNLLNPTLQTSTQNGVTCTNNGDGTYTLNGTATGLVAISLNTINFAKLKENVKLCGCPSGGSNTTYKLSLIISETSVQQNDYGNGVIINNPSILTSNAVSLRIVVYKGTTLKSAIFKPMLTTNLNATYDDFVPYTGDTGSLNGDVADIRKEYATKTEVPLLVKVDGKTVFLSEDGVLSAKGGGGTSIAPKAVSNVSIKNGNGKVSISWTDPNDVTLEGITLSTWAGTKLVMNESDYPTNENDGTVILNSTTRNQYQSTGYTVTGLTNNKTYYFALFPYSTDEIYNYSETGRLLGKPSLVKLDPCTNMKATATMGKVTVAWTDPAATKAVDGNTATWQKTVLIYKQGTTAPTDVNDGTIAVEETTRNQYQSTGYEVTSLIDGNDYSFSLFAISTDSAVSDATSVSAKLYATLTVTTEETKLYGKAVTVTSGSQKVTGTFSNSGSVTLKIPWIGSTVVSSTDGIDTTTATVNIAEYGKSYNAELSFLKIVTFADGTDAEIIAMIEAHYNNKINIQDYWAVGDIREIGLSAMSATYVGESHLSGTYKFAIADFDHDELVTAINGHTKAAVTLTQVDCLMDIHNRNNPVYGESNTENGYMNSSDTNFGGWKECDRRKWCNEIYYNAIIGLQDIVKEVNKKSAKAYGSSTMVTTADKVFLLSEIEIFGSRSITAEGEGSQYQYFKNATANRYKLPRWGGNMSHIWWQRSPSPAYSEDFCAVNYNGETTRHNAHFLYGIAPCFCI